LGAGLANTSQIVHGLAGSRRNDNGLLGLGLIASMS
jgi:hypothetical protein